MKRVLFVGSVLILVACIYEVSTDFSWTHPLIVTLLLCIASLSIVFSLFSATSFMPIILHVISMLAVYGLFLYNGTLTFFAIVALLIGMTFLLIELSVPGGIIGTIGFALIVISLMMMTPNEPYMLYSILTALVVAVVGMVMMMKFFGKKLNIFNKMVLSDKTDTESGYVSNVNRLELIGETAVTATPLRPSGTAMYGSERLDVVTEGGFIPANTEVTIIAVEGARIVVRTKNK
ncbi:NfeD family protein [Kurthia massiliensis]|uniref:NfeD family protein n=1 Tax=Kurthia massiliensis TaxID=1033739 RepID=UPI000289AB3D|nr:NfeD family protein [Kurthia massiliensis]